MKLITGLTISGRKIGWTMLREGSEGLLPPVSKTVVLDMDETAADDPDRVAEAIRIQCPELAGGVTVGVASEQALIRVVELPTADGNEVNDMVRLQVDKLSPFPGDKMASSFEILKVGDNSCRVLIATIRRSVIDRIGEICRKAGLDVLRMDLEVMGWWKLLCEKDNVLSAGRQVLILMEETDGVIMASQDGMPVSFKSISLAGGLPEEDYTEEIASETGALVLDLDLEQGECPVSRIDLLHCGSEPGRIADRLREEFGDNLRIAPLASLPPLSEGLARRFLADRFPELGTTSGLRGIESVMDLVPPAWRAEAAAARLKRKIITASAVVLGAWLAGMVILGVGYNAQLRRLSAAEERMELLQPSADEVRALQRRVNSFEQYLDGKRSVLECLLEIDNLRPDEIKLTAFQFRKGRNVLVRGESLAVEPIIDFKQQLDESDLFDTIEMGSIQPRKRKNQTVQTFQMNARMPEQMQ